MIPKQYGTLKGLKINVLVYESVDEADQAAGKAGAVLESANDNFHYRGGPAQETRDYICEMLEKETGIAMKMRDTGKKTDAGEAILVPDEAEGEFAARVCAEKGWADLKQFQPNLDAWAATADDGKPLAVSAKARERKSSLPKKLANRFKEWATKVLGGVGNLERWAEAYENVVGKPLVFTPTNDQTKTFTAKHVFQSGPKKGQEVTVTASDKDAETLGWLYKEYETIRDEKAAAAELEG